MPNPVPPVNEDGSLRPYTPEEVALMKIQWRGIRQGETPTLSFGISENRGEATCFVNPAELDSAILYFVGHAIVVTPEDEGEPKYISRLLPFRMPGREGFVVTKITKIHGHRFEGKQPGVNWPAYEKVEVGLLYETPKYELIEDAALGNERDRYVEPLPATWTSETIASLGGTLKYARDPAGPTPDAPPHGKQVNANSSFKTQPSERWSVLWWRVPFDAIRDGSDLWARLQGNGDQDDVPLIGAINSAPIFSRPTGTVELKGVTRTLDVSPLGDGKKEWRVEYLFETLPSGKNWIWYSQVGAGGENGWYMITSKVVGGNPVFATADAVGDKDSIYAARDLATELFRP